MAELYREVHPISSTTFSSGTITRWLPMHVQKPQPLVSHLLTNYITVEDRRANFKQQLPQIMKAMTPTLSILETCSL